MALVTIKPTNLDKLLANGISAHTTPAVEKTAELLTWAADEKVLLTLAALGWLLAARRPENRPIANHILIVSLLSAVLPHVIKNAVDQTRPDRLTVRGHWRGVPLSGRRRDAFPSGHALHMGALASAAGLLPTPERGVIRSISIVLSVTRVLLLAHWASDVAAGFILGGVLERMTRLIIRPTSRE